MKKFYYAIIGLLLGWVTAWNFLTIKNFGIWLFLMFILIVSHILILKMSYQEDIVDNLILGMARGKNGIKRTR